MTEVSGTEVSAKKATVGAAEGLPTKLDRYAGPVRLAEVVVFSPDGSTLAHFTRTLCGAVDLELPGLVLGRLELDSGRAVQLYGLPVRNSPEVLVLDLLISRVVGALLLYPWDVPFLRERAEDVADWYGSRYDAPLLALAYSSRGNPLPESAYSDGISLGRQVRIVGVELDQQASLKRALAVLIDMALERTAG